MQLRTDPLLSIIIIIIILLRLKRFRMQYMLDCIVYSSFDVCVIWQQMSLSLNIAFLINFGTSALVLTEGVRIAQ